jgi:hypothetical protein
MEPLTDADHVRNALARFDQTKRVTDAERDQAFENIEGAAKHYRVDMTETRRRQLGKKAAHQQQLEIAITQSRLRDTYGCAVAAAPWPARPRSANRSAPRP